MNRFKIIGLLLVMIMLVKNVNAQTGTFIAASNENILYTGRIDDSDADNIGFSFPGVSIFAKFEGTSIAAVLTELGSGSTTTTNYFNIIIDNEEPVVLKLETGENTYTLASDLADGEHTLQLFKRTESNVGKVIFSGFYLDEGKSLLAADSLLPNRKIEFIGNSITCGYGNEIAVTDPNNYSFTSVNENNYKAWGAVTAREINARYSCVAYSGRGLMQNNDGNTSGTLPLIYDRVFPDDANSEWDYTRYTPDVIVINLGTNDFAAETNNAAYTVVDTVFISAYVDFIGKLRSYYPNASIICAVGVMMSDSYPSGAQQWTRIRRDVASAVVEMNNIGDDKVFYLGLSPQSSPYGEDWHPTAATQQKMADKLVAFINENVEFPDTSSVDDVNLYEENVFTLYPNPCTNKLTIESKADGNMNIYSITGKLVLSAEVSAGVDSIDLISIPKGVYTISFITNKGTYCRKIQVN